MGRASDQEHKNAQAENARRAREAKKANTSSNRTSQDAGPSSTSSLPDAPAKTTKPQPPQPRAKPSTTRRNPPRSCGVSAALSGHSSVVPTTVNPTPATETRPTRKTALAAQTLLQQVQLSMDDDSEEGSDSKAELDGEPEDENSDVDLSDDLAHQSGSDIEISPVVLQPTGQLDISAPPKKKSAPIPTSRTSKKLPPALPDPQGDSAAEEDDGKSLSFHI